MLAFSPSIIRYPWLEYCKAQLEKQKRSSQPPEGPCPRCGGTRKPQQTAFGWRCGNCAAPRGEVWRPQLPNRHQILDGAGGNIPGGRKY
jgi:hypothetical protein